MFGCALCKTLASSAHNKPFKYVFHFIGSSVLMTRPWRVGLFDFGSGSVLVWPKSSGFGFGYCAYYGIKANSLWFYSMQGDRVKKWMFCYSDNVDKELKYNQYIFISSIDSHASHPKQHCCSGETSIQSLEIIWRRSWRRHCKVSSVQEQPNQRWRPQSITGMVEASRVSVPPSCKARLPSASCFI